MTPMKPYSPQDVQGMGIDEICAILEKKMGRQVDASTRIMLALTHPGGSVNVTDLSHPAESGDKSTDYRALTDLMNQPDAEWIKAYTGPKVMFQDPTHFAETFLYALSVSPAYREDRDRLGLRPDDPTPIETLVGCFQNLYRIAQNFQKTGYHFTISPERPHSFYFVCRDAENNVMYNGGIICHGEGEVYSVELTARPGIHWSIHT